LTTGGTLPRCTSPSFCTAGPSSTRPVVALNTVTVRSSSSDVATTVKTAPAASTLIVSMPEYATGLTSVTVRASRLTATAPPPPAKFNTSLPLGLPP
jgi:hypothetical protein